MYSVKYYGRGREKSQIMLQNYGDLFIFHFAPQECSVLHPVKSRLAVAYVLWPWLFLTRKEIDNIFVRLLVVAPECLVPC